MSAPLPGSLFERVLIPVASEADARMARETVIPYLAEVGGVATVLHVIRAPEDDLSPSPPEAQAEDAERLFDIVRDGHDEEVLEVRTAYGGDVAEAIFEVAREIDASAIVFSPEEKSRLIRFLTGDTALSLVTDPEVPVLSIPRRDGSADD